MLQENFNDSNKSTNHNRIKKERAFRMVLLQSRLSEKIPLANAKIVYITKYKSTKATLAKPMSSHCLYLTPFTPFPLYKTLLSSLSLSLST